MSPKGVYDRKLKPLVAAEVERQEEYDLNDGENAIKVSPTPRPLPKSVDDRVEWNARMRARALEVYQRMQQGEAIPIGPDSIDVIQWMRAHGVRIRAVMAGGSTVYELVEKGATERV